MSNGHCPICKLNTRVTSGHYAAGGAMCGCDPKDRQAARRREILSKIEMICRTQAEEHIRQLIEKYDRENDVDV